MAGKRFKTLHVSEECFNQISDLAKVLNKTKSGFLKEVIDNLWQVGLSFRHANLTCESRITSGIVLFQFFGSQRLLHGIMSHEEELRERGVIS